MRSPAAEYALRCEEKASTSHGRSPCRKSATVKIVHWGRLGIDLGHVVSREFLSSLAALQVRLLWVLSF
jgi:hypothetical protein